MIQLVLLAVFDAAAVRKKMNTATVFVIVRRAGISAAVFELNIKKIWNALRAAAVLKKINTATEFVIARRVNIMADVFSDLK